MKQFEGIILYHLIRHLEMLKNEVVLNLSWVVPLCGELFDISAAVK